LPANKLLKIRGEIPLNEKIALKIDEIEGKIPPIYSKNMKMVHFACLNGKNSPYIPRSSSILQDNGKNSPYLNNQGSFN
jgi:hypothetical protein